MLLSVLVAEDVDVSSTTSAFRSFTVSVPVDEAVNVAKPLSEQFSIPVMSTVALLRLLICAVEVVTVPILVSEALEQVSRQRGADRVCAENSEAELVRMSQFLSHSTVVILNSEAE